jgi:8-oxo-dGTP pyrophosphatase MutT (NUDIX family)
MPLNVVNKKIGYEGKIIRVMESTMSDGRVFEKAIRSPGTRIIIYDEEKDQLLLNKEYRQEINDDDYRLPGGKVKDSIKEWDEIKDRADLLDLIAESCKKEAVEEAGVEVEDISLFTVSTSGGPTVEWSLYFFVAGKFKKLESQKLEVGEDIKPSWFSSKEAIEICLSGRMKEGRSAAALLQFFRVKGKI